MILAPASRLGQPSGIPGVLLHKDLALTPRVSVSVSVSAWLCPTIHQHIFLFAIRPVLVTLGRKGSNRGAQIPDCRLTLTSHCPLCRFEVPRGWAHDSRSNLRELTVPADLPHPEGSRLIANSEHHSAFPLSTLQERKLRLGASLRGVRRSQQRS